LCVPFLGGGRDEPAGSGEGVGAPGAPPQRGLGRRIVQHLAELFVFVVDPAVPATNNAAERSLRPLVVSRKISGGTRSATGSATKMALASLFGTWRAQGLNPLHQCRQLLAAPQP
jgi:transposase